ncbi:MAG: tetratricopeptide repeat protein [Xanthobacteraceae bacterium]|nr:tetratricopeptide repeat protein [Xanthobacteraceae bacterium]
MTISPFNPISVIEDLGDRERGYLVATLFTQSYARKCQALRASCSQFELPFIACEVAAVHQSISVWGGDDPASTKAAMIYWALERYQKPVLYIDCDCEIRSDPTLIDTVVAEGHDFAAYNWLADMCTDGFSPISLRVGNATVVDRFYQLSVHVDHYATDQLMVSGAVQLYAPTSAARALLAQWQQTILSTPGALDDGCLAFAFNNANDRNINLRPFWLPKAYARYPWWITERPVIEHPDQPNDRDDQEVWKNIRARTGKDRVYLEKTMLQPPTRPCKGNYVIDTQELDVYCVDQSGQLISAGRKVDAVWLPDRRQTQVETTFAVPSDAKALYEQALAACDQGRFDGAIDILRHALALAPDDARSHRLLGAALAQLGRHAEALSSIERALALAPSARSHGLRGDSLAALGRNEEAVASYDQALAMAPLSVEDWCNRGLALHELKRHEEAIASFDRALAVTDTFCLAHFNRGNALIALGRLDEAVESFDRALLNAGEFAPAHFGRGTALAALQRHPTAIESFDRAIAIDPDYADAHEGRANSLERLGQDQDALASLDRVPATSGRRSALVMKAFILLKLRRMQEALACCDRALAVTGNDPRVLRLRTDILIELDRIDEATRTFDRIGPGNGTDAVAGFRQPLDRRELAKLVDSEQITIIPWHQATAPPIASHGRPAALVLQGVEASTEVEGWPQLRNALFTAGYLPLKQSLTGDGPNVIYVRSELLTDPLSAGVSSGSAVGMWNLGNNGRFANQLWQYLFVSMYGFRNGLVVETPRWEGEDYFGFRNRRPRPRPTMEYHSFSNEHLKLWHSDMPARNVNFSGYFQAVPEAWRPHRKFIRRLFTLKPAWRQPFDDLSGALSAQRRTLVAVHVRRGDYVSNSKPEFRTVPTSWYCDALQKLWPLLQSPVLHVATDEPDLVEDFSAFPQLDVTKIPADMPDHVRDFTILREAHWLLACNSSNSMMATLLADEDQKCLVVDFKDKEFVPFDLWQEGSFWHRFVSRE